MTGRGALLRRLEAALATMEPRTREVFLLPRVADLAYSQIAQRLGIDVLAVECELAAAIVHLDRELQKSEEEG